MNRDHQNTPIFIDVEASGLHSDSYPIEIGWFGGEERQGSFLINPLTADDDWSDWDEIAENIHGISRQELTLSGLDVMVACKKLNESLEGRTVVSDGFEYDHFWIQKLYSQTLLSPSFKLISIEEALKSEDKDFALKFIAVAGDKERIHRAKADAECLFSTWSALTSSPP